MAPLPDNPAESAPEYVARWAGLEPLEPRVLLSAPPAATPFATPDFRIYRPAGSVHPATPSPGPVGLSPATIRHAYTIDQLMFGPIVGDGTGQTIAIVDAYNAPTIAADFHTFNQTFFAGQPEPTLTVVGQTGTSTLPGTDPAGPGFSWAVEISLDVEWAHVVAPKANILLVEANSNLDSDLFAAIDTARQWAGVSVVSMSWGGGESSGELSLDSHFMTPAGHGGVTFVASSGDSGAFNPNTTTVAAEHPAVSPNVLAVGGTRLTVDGSNNYVSEIGWGNGAASGTANGSGGGVSLYESQPAYQVGVVPTALTTTHRAEPDVAFDADPASGVPVIDTWDFGASTPWDQIGGTSLAAPMWAGVVALANQDRALLGLASLDGPGQTLPKIYALPGKDFHDILSGDNGYPNFTAGPGWDIVTGRGTPIVNLLVPDLAAPPLPAIVTSSPTGVVGSPISALDFTFTQAMDTTSFSLADVVSFTGPVAPTLTGYSWTNSTTLHVTFTPTSAQGAYQMILGPQILSAASESPLDQNLNGTPGEVPGDQYTTSFRYDAIVIQPDSSAPAVSSTDAVPLTALTYHFNEPYAAASISTGDLALSRGTVTGFQPVDAQTVQYNLSGLTSEGPLTVMIAAGAVTDLYGNPGAAYSATYSLDITTQAYPAPLTALNPLGSLVYDPAVSANIGTPTDTDSFTLNLAAGQTLTALVHPTSAGLQPSVSITGPGGGNPLGTASATAAGNDALLQTVPVTAAGTYTVTVASTGGTTGNYTLQTTLNAALESENHSGAANNSLATAQNLDGSFVSLQGNAMRGAVLGTTDIPSGGLPTESEPNNTTATADDATHNFTAYSGNLYHLGLTGSVSSNGDQDWFKIGAMDVGDVLTITESGSPTSRGTLSDPFVYLYRYNNGSPVLVASNDDNGPGFDALLFRVSVATADTYYISARAYKTRTGSYSLGVLLENTGTAPLTGGTVTSESEPNGTAGTADDASTSWRAVQYAAQTTATITSGDVDYYKYQFTAGDLITLQAHSTSSLHARIWLLNSAGTVLTFEDGTSTGMSPDSWVYGYIIPTTGTYYMEVGAASGTGAYTSNVYLSTGTPPPAPNPGHDWYSFSLAAGDTTTLALSGSTTANVTLTDGSGSVLATAAAGATNLDQAIHNFSAPYAGLYYVHITDTSVNNYTLLIGRNTEIDSHPNQTLAAAQNINASHTVLGYLAAAGSDFYSFQALAGETITAATGTPGGGSSGSANTLDPALELYDPAGNLVAADDNSALDGRNAALTFVALTTGTYKVHVLSGGATAGDYTLAVAAHPTAAIDPVSPSAIDAPVDSITIQFSTPITPGSFTLSSLTLQTQGGPNLLTSGQTLTTADNQTFVLGNLAGLLTGTVARYTLTLTAAGSGITDVGGNALAANAATDLIVTRAGDANLDGSVDGLDAAIWAANFTGSLGPNPPDPKTWQQGDWNHDGSVDGLDIALWANNFTGSLGGAPLMAAAPTLAGATTTITPTATATTGPAPVTSSISNPAPRTPSLHRASATFSPLPVGPPSAKVPPAWNPAASALFPFNGVSWPDTSAQPLSVFDLLAGKGQALFDSPTPGGWLVKPRRGSSGSSR